MSKHAARVVGYSEVKLPMLEAGHRRCSCHDEIPAEKWRDHIRGCARKIAEKAKRSS